MTTGLSATVFLTDSSIREPKDESGDEEGEEEEEEALAATALAQRAARERRGRDSKQGRERGRPRAAVGRRRRVMPGGGIGGWRWRKLSRLLSSLSPPAATQRNTIRLSGWDAINSLLGLGFTGPKFTTTPFQSKTLS